MYAGNNQAVTSNLTLYIHLTALHGMHAGNKGNAAAAVKLLSQNPQLLAQIMALADASKGML